MSEMSAQHETTTEAKQPYRFGGYLRVVLLVVLSGYLLPFAIERIPGVESNMGSAFSPGLEYAYETNGEDADVVIFGDSAAMINLDPVAMSKSLGWKVINLPDTASSLPMTGENMLQHYLAHNKAPKLIVLYLALPDLDYKHMGEPLEIYEGQEMLASHGTWAQTVAFAKRRPLDLLMFPLRFYSVAPSTGFQARVLHRPRTPQVRAEQGHFDPMAHHASMTLEPCTLHARKQYVTTSAAEFIAQYTTPQTAVLPYVSPIPDCVDAGEVVSASFAGMSAAPPKIMPRTDYKLDNSYVHLQPFAVPEATAALTDAVRAKLGK